jgi:uncharacterized protein
MPRRVWAIADPHLSFAHPKPMDIFGSHWAHHAERIAASCGRLIEPDDLLLIPGDISWAMKRKDAEPDLAFLASLPGIKVLCKGNHDYWWNSDKPLAHPGLNDTPFVTSNLEIGVAGTRGWTASSEHMTVDEKKFNDKIITREVKRLTRRLTAIAACPIKYVIVHYPPLEEFADLMHEFGVSTILYGHLHLSANGDQPIPERWHTIKSLCVAADRINFTPKLIQTL